jgi:hypothetical protein
MIEMCPPLPTKDITGMTMNLSLAYAVLCMYHCAQTQKEVLSPIQPKCLKSSQNGCPACVNEPITART